MPRSFSRNAFETGASGPITSPDTTISVDSVLGLQAPGYLVIDPDSDTKREYIFYSALGASSLDNVTRGLTGSASGAQAHDSGVRIRAVPVHQWLDDLWDGIENNETALANHEVNADPHPLYLLQSEADALYVELTGDQMTGVLNMQGNAVSNLPTGGAGGDAASVTYADNLIGTHEGAIAGHPEFLDLPGVRPMTGALNMGNTNKVINLANPSLAQDAATKFYVDGLGPFLELAGGTLSGDLDLDGNLLLNPADPTLGVHVGDRDYSDARYLRVGQAITVGGTITPLADTTHDLGSATLTWRRVYSEAQYDEGGTARVDWGAGRLATAFSIQGAFTPASNNTHDLGSTALRWRRGFFEELRRKVPTPD